MINSPAILAIFAATLMRHLNHNTGGTSEFQDVNLSGRETTGKNETLSFDTVLPRIKRTRVGRVIV